MYCSNCGQGDQSVDSYCRRCGEFLSNLSGRSLLSELLGGQKPETQVTAGLVTNAVTAIISLFLLGFLNGYYDAQFDKTHVGPPGVIYLVYVFLGVITVWQMLSFAIGWRLRKKIAGRLRTPDEKDTNAAIQQASAGSLPAGDPQPPVRSITESTTRELDALPRKHKSGETN